MVSDCPTSTRMNTHTKNRRKNLEELADLSIQARKAITELACAAWPVLDGLRESTLPFTGRAEPTLGGSERPIKGVRARLKPICLNPIEAKTAQSVPKPAHRRPLVKPCWLILQQ
mmetsp:Transcript_13270/g.30202  ORF Transcript_13270/g.30202 Transcript_13270/m.30202 type:complete len:115 (+) Transcript_13270:912-1256(+)